MPLICLNPQMFPCMSVCSQGYLHVIWGIHPIYWDVGGISTSVRHFGVCRDIHCSQSVGCFLWDWLLECLLCFMLYLSCSSLCLKSHPLRLTCMAILTGLWCRLSNSLPWVCLSLFPQRKVERPGHGLGSISHSKRDLCQGLVVHIWLRGLICRVGMRFVQVTRSLPVAVFPPVLLILGREGAVGVGAPDVLLSSAFSSSSSVVFQVGILFKFLDQWRSITSNRLVLNMVQGHLLQLRYHPPLFYNFWQFNVKAALVHHPTIQK